MFDGLLLALNTAIPERVYGALPDLPRVRWRLLPIANDELVFDRWVFALRDNSTSRRLHSPLTLEHIEAVRKELGLEDDQQPQWVHIPVYVQICFQAPSPSLIHSCCTRF